MKIRICRTSKFTCCDILLNLILIMPFVDSISGALHGTYPVGQIYRAILFAYMLLLLLKHSKKRFVWIGVSLFAFSLVQILISIDLRRSIQDVVKLFTPIVLICLFITMLHRQKIGIDSVIRLMERWAIYYPILILIPGILGIGKNAYDGTAGWKGFFYATNEISFIMSCLIMFLVWRLYRQIDVKTIILLGLNILTLLLMGTKTGYATTGVFAVIYFIKSMKERKPSKILKNISIVIIGCAAIICLYIFFFDEINAIFERWMYQKNVFSYSLIDFLTSHRLRRFHGAWTSFIQGEIWYIPFGCGFGAEYGGFENMEMDGIDLFFRVGITGTVFVFIFYFRYFVWICKSNFWGFAIMFWMFLLSFGAGHVLFYGQSGMMLGIMVVVCKLIQTADGRNELIGSHLYKL